jgi:hypothetical protein
MVSSVITATPFTDNKMGYSAVEKLMVALSEQSRL